MLSELFKKKDKQSSRVAAIVKYYDELQLPIPRADRGTQSFQNEKPA